MAIYNENELLKKIGAQVPEESFANLPEDIETDLEGVPSLEMPEVEMEEEQETEDVNPQQKMLEEYRSLKNNKEEPEKQLSERELALQALKKNIEEMQKTPEKKEITAGEYLPDVLAGLYNIYNFAQGSEQPSMQMGSIAAARKAQQEQEKNRQARLGKLQDMYTNYLGMLEKEPKAPSEMEKIKLQTAQEKLRQLKDKKPDELSARDKAYLEYYNKSLELKKEQQKEIEKRQQSSFKQRDIDRKLKADDKIYKVTEDYEKNPVVKELNQQGISFDQLESLSQGVAEGNEIALGSMGTKAARAMGEVGVLTDQDVKRYIQAQSIPRKVLDVFSKSFKGTLSDLSRQELQQVADIMRIGAAKKKSELYDRYVKKAYKNYGEAAGLDIQTVEDRFGIQKPSPIEFYDSKTKNAIYKFMEANNIENEQEAIDILKKNNKI